MSISTLVLILILTFGIAAVLNRLNLDRSGKNDTRPR
jgi:hypothetical protein